MNKSVAKNAVKHPAVPVAVVPGTVGFAVFAAVVLTYPGPDLSGTRFAVGAAAWLCIAFGGGAAVLRLLIKKS